MSANLDALLEAAKHVQMTVEQRELQRRSFAYGNTKIENDLIKREMIDERADALRKSSDRYDQSGTK